MKKILITTIILSITILAICSCKKQSLDKGGCYECRQFNQNGVTSNFIDAGCMSADEWKTFQLTDYAGNDVDKYQYCRRR